MFGTIVIFTLIPILLWYIKSCKHPKHFPPGPRVPLPLLGDAYILGDDFHIGFIALIKKYGKTVGFWLGEHRTILISDFETLQTVLNLNEASDRGGIISTDVAAIMRRGLSNGSIPGVLLSNGKTWVESRRTSLHVLRNLGFGKNVMEEMIEDEINNLFEHIDHQWVDTPVDAAQFFNISVLSSLWRLVSGESLKIDDPKLIGLCKMVQQIIMESGDPLQFVASKSVPFLKFLNYIGVYGNFGRMEHLFDYCQEVINSCKQRDIDGDNPLTFVEAMVHKSRTINDETDPLHGDLGELNLLSIVADFFFAGADTSSNSLNWSMLYMIKHPEVQAKVRKELTDNIGMSRAKMVDRSLTPYTEAVLHELARLSNILPTSVFHQANEPLTIGDFKIPSKTIIIPMIGEVMHDPEHFPDPMMFNPDRYITQNGDGVKKFTPHPRVLQFGIGKRRCLGENLARATLYKFLTAIIQKYEIVSGQEEPITEDAMNGFVRAPKPFKLKFVKL